MQCTGLDVFSEWLTASNHSYHMVYPTRRSEYNGCSGQHKAHAKKESNKKWPEVQNHCMKISYIKVRWVDVIMHKMTHCKVCQRNTSRRVLIRLECTHYVCRLCHTNLNISICSECHCKVCFQPTLNKLQCTHSVCIACYPQLWRNTGRTLCPYCRAEAPTLYVSKSYIDVSVWLVCISFWYGILSQSSINFDMLTGAKIWWVWRCSSTELRRCLCHNPSERTGKDSCTPEGCGSSSRTRPSILFRE